MTTRVKRIKVLGIASAVLAGLAVSSAPAQARNCEAPSGGLYDCDYGITLRGLGSTEYEEFVVGADKAVWTRHSAEGHWGGWTSLGGAATSEVFVEADGNSNEYRTTLIVLGTDGKPWAKVRPGMGQGWTDWARAPRPE
ncbi:hypothetical protein AB0D66_26580 [Streptomyces sp. NPDC048270]|uniref:hypothetical protein n=1 Tax=Streptomyces sp. NPDC048270 TaxID=3154615 RepID=UPI003407C983